MNRLSDIDAADDSDVDSDIDNSSEVSSKENEFLTTRSMLKKFMQGHMVGIYMKILLGVISYYFHVRILMKKIGICTSH